MKVFPKTKANVALAKAVRAPDLAAIRKALEDGASPDVFLESMNATAVEQALRWQHSKDPAHRALDLVSPFVEKGVNLLGVYFPDSRNSHKTLRNRAVRRHPVLGPMALSQLRAQGGTGVLVDKGTPLEAWIEVFSEPGDAPFLDWVLQSDPVGMDRKTWWTHVLSMGTPWSVSDAAERFAKPSPQEVLEWAKDGSLKLTKKVPSALLDCIKGLPPRDQVHALLGSPASKNPGLLGYISTMGDFYGGAMWEWALQQPHVLQAMSDRGTLPGYTALAVRYLSGPKSLAWCQAARALGVDLPAVRWSDADAIAQKLSTSLADVLSSRPDRPDHTLLDASLSGNQSDQVSAPLCRWLAAHAAPPTSRTLALLVSQMTYEAKERKLVGVFREWVRAGVDPAPPGEAPAWESVRSGLIASVGARLEAWCRQYALENSLAATPAQPVRRLRL